MGRGRAKAKQTKVARRLKYAGPDTDLQALENELRTSDDDGTSFEVVDDDEDEFDDDPYAKYLDDEDDDEDD